MNALWAATTASVAHIAAQPSSAPVVRDAIAILSPRRCPLGSRLHAADSDFVALAQGRARQES
jgi:hypothetical protein